MTSNASNEAIEADLPAVARESRLWRNSGWTARIIKNEDDEGWAVERIKDGEPEPALVGPWTMGRSKKNLKPIDAPHALLTVHDANDEKLAQVRVAPGFKLNKASANAWIEDDFRKPG
jgi:hypothetical protein